MKATLKAADFGADMEDYVILGACNPPLAHRAVDIDRQIGLLLPCNVVVRTDPDADGTVIVEAMNPMLAGGSHGRACPQGEWPESSQCGSCRLPSNCFGLLAARPQLPDELRDGLAARHEQLRRAGKQREPSTNPPRSGRLQITETLRGSSASHRRSPITAGRD